MDKGKPWWPRLRGLPLFNPFESSTQWTAQIGAGDRIEIEDEEAVEDSVPANPTEDKAAER